MGKFVMKETKNGGVKFDLKAGNGEVIATSEAYSGDAACKKGIESVRKNAVEAKLEDQTVEGFETVTNPKFEVYTDKAGEFRFRLKATNGEIIAAGMCAQWKNDSEFMLKSFSQYYPRQKGETQTADSGSFADTGPGSGSSLRED